MKFKLKIKNPDFNPGLIAGKTRLSDAAVRVLNNRGLSDAAAVLKFLGFKPFQFRTVAKMKDAERFLSKLQNAIETGKHITIYGDYDGDGVMATMIWYMGLTKLGANPNWFVNNRFTEGYGMNQKGVERMLALYPETEFVVTCDNGIKAHAGIQYALDRGVDVVVSDHHGQSEGEDLPNCPVVCEKRLDEDPNGEWFCGAELSRRLVVELFKRLGVQRQHRDFLQGLYAYAGLATITDSIGLNASNHYLVKEALKEIASEKEIVWTILREETKPTAIDQDLIGFKYGPMINAAGRVHGTVDDAMAVFLNGFWYEQSKTSNSFDTETNAEALGYAAACRTAVLKLIQVNEERKNMSAAGDKLAFEIVKNKGWDKSKFIVVDSEQFEEGINGLISGHLTEMYKVPSLVLCPKDGEPEIYKGSARSVEGFNLFEELNKCKDLMLGFGGHPGAAGLSVTKDNIPLLREKLEAIAEKHVPEPESTVEVDFILRPEDISPKLSQDLTSLMPYGEGFAKPMVGFQGKVKEVRILKDRHVKFSIDLSGNEPSLDIFWWNSIQQYNEQLAEIGHISSITCVGSAPTYRFDNGVLKRQMYVTMVTLA